MTSKEYFFHAGDDLSKTFKKSIRENQPAEQKELPILAIDGGGTKTIAVITDKAGNVLSTGKSGTANYHVAGKKGAINTLKEVIVKAVNNLKKYHYPDRFVEISFHKCVFALAGIDTKKDQVNVDEIVSQALAQSGIKIDKVIIENDALSVLLGATNNQPGAILIAGTGSIVFAHDGKENYVRTGGFGHRLGDEGSGYWIGKQAISAILKMHDGRGPKTLLQELVLEHFNFTDHEALYNWVYSPDFSIHQVGALAKIVEKANYEGDGASRTILEQSADELYQLVSTAVNRVGIVDVPFKLLLLGGVLQNSHFVKGQLLDRVKQAMPGAELLYTHKKPIELIIQRGLNG
ncbi:BadF/BadG/BcrA/BcrD ATPase family protein [Oceanobacillus indicireducens]|uniref:BadF/BadG/BcrA/BcrD ATPase family protein n=1 Tax=Oceanobacillus indicireducens TaxID=1004261 RepID=UPI0016648970|nr:BadF/BadG/BcrA/BcrD ATPase family protein [Oceanobacillus indicireducens]